MAANPTQQQAGARVLLVETRPAARFRQQRAEYFPFLLGLARQLGWDAQWVVIGVPRDCIHLDSQQVIDLPEDRRALLAQALAAAAPDVVVMHDRPTPELAARLHAAQPAARLVDLTHCPRPQQLSLRGTIQNDFTVADIAHLLGFPAQDLPHADELFLDVAQPCFAQQVLTPDAAEQTGQPVRLVVENYCPYRRRVANNPHYEHLESEAAQNHRGCSFCLRPSGDAYRLRTPPIEHVLRQIEAHQRAAQPGAVFAYLFDDTRVSTELERLFAAVLERNLLPATFHVKIRVDVLLALARRLEPLLPLLAAAGHRIRVLSVGAENFSEVENARFNKGISQAQIWACYERMRDLEARFAGTFASGDVSYFSGILFTPWTRPQDLQANLEAAQRLGPEWLKKVIGTRLQLWEGAPITELARHDGLCVDTRGAAADLLAVCRTSPDEREAAWRFADAGTERIYRLLVRLEPVSPLVVLAPQDALFAEIRQWRAGLPKSLAEDYIGLAVALVAAVVALGPEAPTAAVLAHATPPAVAEPPPEPEAPPTAAPQPPPPVAPNTLGELHIQVQSRGVGAAGQTFFIARQRAQEPGFARVGPLRLWHGHGQLTRPTAVFAQILVLAMRARQDKPLRAASEARWRKEVATLLAQTGLADRYSWTLQWTPEVRQG